MKRSMTLILGIVAVALALAAWTPVMADLPTASLLTADAAVEAGCAAAVAPLWSPTPDVVTPWTMIQAGYECPTGVPYCWRASQCGNYCQGGQAVCEFGCCACAS